MSKKQDPIMFNYLVANTNLDYQQKNTPNFNDMSQAIAYCDNLFAEALCALRFNDADTAYKKCQEASFILKKFKKF